MQRTSRSSRAVGTAPRAFTLAAAITVLVALAPPPTAAAAAWRACRDVPFTPMSDDVAASIRVRGVGCRYARDFIRGSSGRPGRQYRGFTCGRRNVNPVHGLAHTRYRCRRATRTIFWKRF